MIPITEGGDLLQKITSFKKSYNFSFSTNEKEANGLYPAPYNTIEN
jgi:hypothetical protein